MRARLRLAILTVLALGAVAVESAPFPHETSDLAPDPAVRWGRLANGLRWCAMPNQQPRGKISLRLQVASGSLLETEAQRGLAHYLEHLAFNGTTSYPPGELNKRLQPLGIAFGTHSNAHTSFDETVYKIDLPDAGPATLALGLGVLADFAGGMLLLPAEIERERGIIQAEMRDRDSPGFRQRKAVFAAIFPGLAIPRRFPIGEPETIAAATPELIRDYYEAWYRPERMTLAVVGAIDPGTVGDAIEAALGGIAAKAPARPEPAVGILDPA
jgi:zinc protease